MFEMLIFLHNPTKIQFCGIRGINLESLKILR